MNKKRAIIIIIITLALIIALFAAIFSEKPRNIENEKTIPEETFSPVPTITQEPTVTPEEPTETPATTATPVPTPKPTEAPKGIPVIKIYTDKEVESRNEYVTGSIVFDGKQHPMQIRGRGNASWSMTDKKAYRIKLDEKASLLGMRANRDWVLVSNYFDKSLIRNVVAHTMAQEMEYLYYTPTHVLCELYLNDDYRGVYTIADKIEIARHKIELNTGDNPDEPGFLIEIGWDYSKTNVRDRDYFDTPIIVRLFVKEPKIESANNSQMKYIKNYMKKAEDAILADGNYEDYVDIDAFVDWFIIAELTNNTEMAFYRSCYLYKPDGGKIIMGPVWDFDMAFGNHRGDIDDYDGWATAEAEYTYVNDTWATYLVKSPRFMEKVKARWQEKKQILLDAAFKCIDEQYSLVKDAAERNFGKWDILHEQIGEGNVDYDKYDTYEKQVMYLKEFLTERAEWIDKELGA